MMNSTFFLQRPSIDPTQERDRERVTNETLAIGSISRLAHLAWVLMQLVRISVVLRQDGWCLGATTPAETVISVAGLSRARVRLSVRPWLSLRGFIHAKWFHDAGCEAVGISFRLFRKWIETARHVRGGVLLEEAYAEAVEEIHVAKQAERSAYEAWSQLHGEVSAEDIVMLHILRVITPESPWNTKESPSRSSRTPNRVLRRKKR